MNSHFARVWFPEFLAGDDLEETEQLAAVGEVGEEVVHLHLGLQQEAVHPFCESLLLDVQPLFLQCSEMREIYQTMFSKSKCLTQIKVHMLDVKVSRLDPSFLSLTSS